MFGWCWVKRLAGLICVAWLTGCAPGQLPAPDDGEATRTVYIVSNGWHAGIVFARSYLPPGKLPEVADFPGAAFLDFGWGDREYYPAPDPSLGMALGAALIPSPSVIHLAGLAQAPRPFENVEVLGLRVSEKGLDRMIDRIVAAFDRPEGGRAEAVAPGLYSHSLFYPAHGRFHLFNTCNTWVARMLASAGLPLSPFGVITANDLMERLRELPNAVRLDAGYSSPTMPRSQPPP